MELNERDVRAQNIELRRQIREIHDRQLEMQLGGVAAGVIAQAPAMPELGADQMLYGLPVFQGKRGDNFIEWLAIFDQLGTSNDWDPDRKRLKLPTRLRGAAWDAYTSLEDDERDTYEHLKTAMTEKLMGGSAKRGHILAFSNRKQVPGESAHDFHQALKKAFQAAYPNKNPRDHDQELQFKFEEGSIHRSQLIMLGPASFEDALAKAENIENSLRYNDRLQSGGAMTVAATGQQLITKSELARLTTQFAESFAQLRTDLQNNELQRHRNDYRQDQARPPLFQLTHLPQRNNGNFRGQPVCYECQQEGHHEHCCPTKGKPQEQKFCMTHRSTTHSAGERTRNHNNKRFQTYCAIHKASTHSTEECRNNRPPQQQYSGRKFCKFHNSRTHTTEECHQSSGNKSSNPPRPRDNRGAPQGLVHTVQKGDKNLDHVDYENQLCLIAEYENLRRQDCVNAIFAMEDNVHDPEGELFNLVPERDENKTGMFPAMDESDYGHTHEFVQHERDEATEVAAKPLSNTPESQTTATQRGMST